MYRDSWKSDKQFSRNRQPTERARNLWLTGSSLSSFTPAFAHIKVSFFRGQQPNSVLRPPHCWCLLIRHRFLCTSDQLVAEASTYTTHNKHKRRTPMPSAGFKSAIPAIERPQNYASGLPSRLCCTITAKYCVYPGCGRHTGNVHPAACWYWQVSRWVLILHLWCSRRTRQLDTRSRNLCGSSLKYTSFTVSCLYAGKTGNRTAKLWNVSSWTADRHIVCWLRTAVFCDVTPCSLVTVVQVADRICGTTRVHSSAVADQSNCSPGYDAM